MEEGVDITDFINRIVYILKWDLGQLKVSIQEVGLLKLEDPIKVSDKG